MSNSKQVTVNRLWTVAALIMLGSGLGASCQYPGGTPSRISADVGGVIATNVQPASSAGNVAVNSMTYNTVNFTLGNGGSQYPPTASSTLSCIAYAPDGVVETLYSSAIQGSASINFQWEPTVVGSYQIVCSAGQGAYYVQNQNLVVDVS